MNEHRDLELIIKSRVPIIAIESQEEPRVLGMVAGITRRLGMRTFRWTVTEGLHVLESSTGPEPGADKPIDVLGHIKTKGNESVYILLDFHHYLKDSVHIRLLKDIALNYDHSRCTVILLSHRVDMPEELKRFSGQFELPLPDAEELRSIVCDVAGEWGAEHGDQHVSATNKSLDLLVRNLAGLTASDARRLARNAIYDDGAITYSDIPVVMKAKYQLLNQNGILSFEYDTAKFSDVGGLKRLKIWLEQRKAAFDQEESAVRLDAPKGVLLTGVQGCGKSLAAKAVAGIFGVPLLRLDFGALYNKYYGETERNLRDALQTAKVMAPCVLWMDEIEKGIAQTDSDDGVSRRVLGTLLTWMAERNATVFVVATANDITALPAELIRKGRFDEIFFVDLPSREIRRSIFQIHMEKRDFFTVQFDMDALCDASEGFSGAEIEQALVSAMYTARATGAKVGTDLLMKELRLTRPLSVLMAEKIQALRDWAKDRTVPAD